MIITDKDRKNFKSYRDLYNKIKSTHDRLMDRLYNPKHKQYQGYGGSGVTSVARWMDIKNFIQDIDSIPGWDVDKFMSGDIELDKDIKVRGNKVYGPETCLWVSHEENMQVRPNSQKPFIAYNEYTQEIKKGLNQKEFATQNNLSLTTLNSVLRGKKHRVGDWFVWWEGKEMPVPKRYIFTDRLGNVTWDVNPRRLSLRMGRDPRYISGLITKGIQPKGTSLDIVEIDLSKLL